MREARLKAEGGVDETSSEAVVKSLLVSRLWLWRVRWLVG